MSGHLNIPKRLFSEFHRKSSLTVRFQSPIIICMAVAIFLSVYFVGEEVGSNIQMQTDIANRALDRVNQDSEKALKDGLISKADSVGRFVADAAKDYIITYDIVQLRKLQQDAMRDPEVEYAIFLKKGGKPYVLGSKKVEGAGVIRKFPIKVAGDLLGSFELGFSTAAIDKQRDENRLVQDEVLRQVNAVGEESLARILRDIVVNNMLLLIALMLVVFFLFRKIILGRINDLKDTAVKVQKGDFLAKIHSPSGDELGTLGRVFNDMTAELHETTYTKDYVENILQSMGDILVVTDSDFRIIKVNRRFLELLGYQDMELIGHDFEEIFKVENGSQTIRQVLVSGADVSGMEAHFFGKEGVLLPVMVSGKCLSGVGLEGGAVITATDISERIKARQVLEEKNQELEDSNKQLDQFAYVVSHDLKAPLRAIANLSSWIEEDLHKLMSEENFKQMELLRGRVNRMEALINGILEYSRAGRLNIDVVEVDVGVMLAEIVESMPVPKGFNIHIGKGMPVLMAPRVPMSQVFSNLISNAIKYRSQDEGKVDVSVKTLGDMYEFSVTDDGPGIAPEFHEKVFEIFQTLTPRDQFESTGVGLSLVKKIVEEQGGSVLIYSDAGQGARFVFTWPVHIKEAEAA